MSQPTILLIDDDIDQLSIVGAMLSNVPFNVITALNGKRALEIIDSDPPILVITDMVLPDISGSEIIHYMRSKEHFTDTKVVIMTSLLKYVTDEDRAMTSKVLLKPFRKKELEAVITELLGVSISSPKSKTDDQ